MSLETWAVAAVAIVDVEGSPLLLRTYTSPKDVLNSPAAPLHAHLYVGPEDIIKLHFVLFASLDRCDELRETAALLKEASTADRTSSPMASMSQRSSTVPSFSPKTASGANASYFNSPAKQSPYPSVAPSTNVSALNTNARLISPTTDARFLGKLLESHRLRSYGFCSATGIRTLLVTVGNDAPADAMVPLCRALYENASAALCNPFRSPAQCYRAQEQLLWMTAIAEGASRAGAAPAAGINSGSVRGSGGASAAGDGAPQPAVFANVSTNVSFAAGVNQQLHLPSGAVEWSWPRGAPTSVASLTAEPTLALSHAFNSQMESLLSSFTVTARSCIIH